MTRLLILSLATWRLSSLITREDGPFSLLARLRRWAGAERPGELSGLAYGITCIWCVSVWAAAALYMVWRWNWPVWILATSAGAILLEAFRPPNEHPL